MKAFGVILLLVCAALPFAFATDEEAREKAAAAESALASGRQNHAGDLYKDAEILADDTVLKAGLAGKRVESYRAAGMMYKEFEAIEHALDRYASYVDVVALVEREYDLGLAYSKGGREPAFWALRWIPWLTGGDKTEEIYKAALKHGPFSPRAQEARIHLAGRLIDDGKSPEALEHLRASVEQDPAKKFPYLFLGEQLYLLSLRGDGDGRYNREALALFSEFKKRFPDASENKMIDQWILELKDVQGARLLEIAKFYHKGGRNMAAERYLNQVIRKYPDSTAAAESEKLLVDLDKTYVPDGFAPEIKPRIPTYSSYPFPEEEEKLLVLPSESGGKFLFPVYKINFGTEQSETKEAK